MLLVCTSAPAALLLCIFICLQIMCRSLTPLNKDVKEKLSMFCHVPTEQVCISDVVFCEGFIHIQICLFNKIVINIFGYLLMSLLLLAKVIFEFKKLHKRVKN